MLLFSVAVASFIQICITGILEGLNVFVSCQFECLTNSEAGDLSAKIPEGLRLLTETIIDTDNVISVLLTSARRSIIHQVDLFTVLCGGVGGGGGGTRL